MTAPIKGELADTKVVADNCSKEGLKKAGSVGSPLGEAMVVKK